MNIAIFGNKDDDEVKAVELRLRNRGANPIVFDLADFPSQLRISNDKNQWYIDKYRISDLSAAFLRNRGIVLPQLMSSFDSQEQWKKFYNQFYTFLNSAITNAIVTHSFLNAFSKVRPLVNPVDKNDLHRLKTYLFSFLKKRQCPIPEYCTGTAREQLKEFAQQQFSIGTGVVQKPLAGIYKTYLWNENAYNSHPWGDRGAFYQKYIKGDTIRCYLLDGKLIGAAKIIHGDTIDSSMSQTGIEVLDLNEKARTAAENAAKQLKLAFSGIDLMYAHSTKEYYVIDCNMSPMFVNFSRTSAIDIPAKIAEYLIEISDGSSKKKTNAQRLLSDVKDILAFDPAIREKLKRNR